MDTLTWEIEEDGHHVLIATLPVLDGEQTLTDRIDVGDVYEDDGELVAGCIFAFKRRRFSKEALDEAKAFVEATVRQMTRLP